MESLKLSQMAQAECHKKINELELSSSFHPHTAGIYEQGWIDAYNWMIHNDLLKEEAK